MSKGQSKKKNTPVIVYPVDKKEYFRSLVIFIIRITSLLLTFLILISIMTPYQKVYSDYQALQSMNFFQVARLDFPNVQNVIGPFGALFAFYFHFLFGKLLSIILLITLATYQVALVFRKRILHKIIITAMAALFLNIIVSNLDKFPYVYQFNKYGVITETFNRFLVALFKETGTYIIAITFILFSLIYLLSFDTARVLSAKLLRLTLWILRGCTEFFLNLFNSRDDISPENINKTKKRATDFGSEYEVTIHNDTEVNSYNSKKPLVDEKESSYRKETVKPMIKLPSKVERSSDSLIDGEDEYVLPDIEELLNDHPVELIKNKKEIEDNIARTSKILRNKLNEFDIIADVVNVNVGPIITQYELKPAPGMKVSKFGSVSDDLSLAIKAKSIRIEAPIPGRGLIGIEVPNEIRDIIYLKELLLSTNMKSENSLLCFPLGKDISGRPVVVDLARMPHLLMAGATGSGKSVTINTIICSLLLQTKPEDVRLILIDPKRIELSGYENIPHLIQSVVTEPNDALSVLNWAVAEMERRYSLLQEYKVRDIAGYNKRILNIKKRADKEQEEFQEIHQLPLIVIIVDEFADLIMTAGREIELPITRLAQMARAIGIHLILATQRPSIKVITGIIKANFPARIAFQVSSKIDSRVIIDMNGAEKLLGKGDMLFIPPGKGSPDRIHGAFLSDEEIERIVSYLKTQPRPKDEIEIISEVEAEGERIDYDDPLFPEAIKLVVRTDAASVSMLQRHFKIGYARAGRLIDLLETAKIVGPYAGSKSREVIAGEEEISRYE